MGVQRLRAWLALLACLACVCMCSRDARAQFFSPGPLARSHAALEGDSHCSDCHSVGGRVADDKCLVCHDDIGRSLKNKTGLHGRKFSGRPCASCHIDHRGEDQVLARWEPKRFEHEQTGWRLEGAHARVECGKCHTGKNRRENPTYMGLSNTCASCHEDKHQGRFGRDCTGCHDQVSWKNLDLDPFDHDLARYALRGKHRQVPCAKCHGEPAKYQPLAFDACTSCHQDPHRGKLGAECEGCHREDSWKSLDMKRSAHPGLNIQGGHGRVQCRTCHDRGSLVPPSRGSRCVSCHAPVHEAKFGNDCAECHAQIRWLGLPDELGRRVHGRTSYPLEGKHENTPCDACHSPKRPRAARYRQLASERCADCHRDRHKAQFVDRAGGECSACHDVNGFAPTLFGAQLHASSRFALEGGHEAAPCSACHGDARPRLDWQLSKLACADCHENPHGDQFAQEMRADGCAACHDVRAWDVPNIAHDTWPLTGAHRKARCDQCHTPSEQDRRTGSGVSYESAPRECEGCHADVHLGQFRLSDPVKACTDCHDTATFKLPGFQHLARTGYDLIGKHRTTPCASCHVTSTLKSGERTALWRLPYDECDDCHKNPHVEGN